MVLVGPFGTTHETRGQFVKWKSTSTIDVLNERLKPKTFANIASDYRFVVCPRGNGIDTHRFWETLYRGSLPIVENSEWAQYFKLEGIPMVLVEDYEEILSWSESDFASAWSNCHIPPSKIDGLNPQFWFDKIKQFN